MLVSLTSITDSILVFFFFFLFLYSISAMVSTLINYEISAEARTLLGYLGFFGY